jgi:hypothetical protein
LDPFDGKILDRQPQVRRRRGRRRCRGQFQRRTPGIRRPISLRARPDRVHAGGLC